MAESLGLPTYQIGSGSWTPPLSLFPLPVPFPSICLSFSISQSQGNPLGPFIRCEMLIHLSATCPSREQERVIPPWVLSFFQPHPPQQDPSPFLSRASHHSSRPPPTHPSSSYLFPSSVNLSVCTSIHPPFLPSLLGPISLSSPYVPSINLLTVLPCQVGFSSVRLSTSPSIRLSPSPSIHPSTSPSIMQATCGILSPFTSSLVEAPLSKHWVGVCVCP